MRRSNNDWNGAEIETTVESCDEIETRRENKSWKKIKLRFGELRR